MNVGERISRARYDRKLKRNSLARKAGISKDYLYNLELNKTKNIDAYIIKKIANAMDMRVGDLFFNWEKWNKSKRFEEKRGL